MNTYKYYFLLVTMLFSFFTTTKIVAQDICPNRIVSPIQTCANPDETPYNFHLPFLNINDPRFKLQFGKFKELENGTATLSGDLINVLDGQIQFALSITFNGRSNQLQNPIPHDCLTNLDKSNFYTYTSFQGKLIGNDKMAGSKATITSNGNFLQLGYGANWMDKEFSFGAATNIMVLVSANPSNHPILTVIGRGQRPIECNFGLRLTDCNPCALLGGDTDGDGICDDDDCAPEDSTLPAQVGAECNDGDPMTVNDQYLDGGCDCKGTFDPCAQKGGDTDGDGICDNDDCAPEDSTLPAQVGAECNDGDPMTINDIYLDGGCDCKGTFDPCAQKGGDTDGDGICDDDDCAPEDSTLPAQVGAECNDGDPMTINDIYLDGGCDCKGTFDPCAQKGGDTDGDGICDNDDCAPEDNTLPSEPNTPCNDNDDTTINDIILEDGCSCAGEIETTNPVIGEPLFEYPCGIANKAIETYIIGVKGQNNPCFDIPNPENVSKVTVELWVAGKESLETVTFTTEGGTSGSNSATTPRIVVTQASSSGEIEYLFRKTFDGNYNKVCSEYSQGRSMAIYVERIVEGAGASAYFLDRELHSTNNVIDCISFDAALLPSGGIRDLEFAIPIHEKGNTNRPITVEIDIKGSNNDILATKSARFTEQNAGEEASLFTIDFQNISNQAVTATVNICSPTDNGESFGVGLITFTSNCAEEEEEEEEESEEEENSGVISEVCTIRTASNTTLCQGNFEGINYGGYLLLDGLGRHYSLVNGQFAEYDDGTARLIGEWVNIDDNDIKFQVDVTLAGRTASTPPNSPKGHWCLEPDESAFYYYTQTKGVLRGKGAIEGALLMIGRAGPAFQFGVGANPTNADLTFGAAGWLTATIVNQPSTGMELTLLTSAKGSNGDININLSGDPMTCIENRDAINSSCLEDITVTAAVGTTDKVVNWETPTFSSSCLFNANMDCTATPDQLAGFEYVGALDGSRYFCSLTSYTYAQAKNLAIQNGGYLAVICGQTENDFIASKLTTSVAWIGLSDEVNEGTFIWANGDNCTYTNWLGNDPNDGHSTNEYTGADHTVLQESSGQWLDRNGQASYKFILELPCSGTMPIGTAEMIQTDGLASGTSFPVGETIILYEGKDGCGNITTCSFKVTVQAPDDPCAGDNAPSVTVETQSPDCDGNKGQIIFKFNDHPNRTNLEFSLDGGQTYPLYVADNAGTATFDDLSAGNYDIYVRWGNDECPVDLGTTTLESQKLEVGTTCDDGNVATENDRIQADGCTCQGVTLGADICAVRTAFNTVRCMENGYFETNYGGYLLLKGLERHYSLTNGQFIEYSDGTALLTGEWTNIADDQLKFDVSVTLSGRTASTPPNSPKGHLCLSPVESNFYYYTQTTGTLTGKNKIAGATIMIGRAGPAFQFGVGANPTNNELNFGAAGWLTATIVNQPTTSMRLTLETSPHGSNGDININLSGDPMACIENRGSITPNCIDDIKVIAGTGANSKIVTWNTPTFNSDCLFNSEIDCTSISEEIDGFEYVGSFNGSKYYCSTTDDFTYHQARSLSIQNGGHLAVICNQAENDFLASRVGAEEVWIGYFDSVNEGTFVWSNGAYCGYTNWSSGEPNDGHNTNEFSGADYTILSKGSGVWKDRSGNASYEFVMEIPCSGAMSTKTAPMEQKQGLSSGAAFPVGETTIVYEGKDDCGNSTTCSFKVTVNVPAVTDPCAGDNAPQATVEVTHPDCDEDNGKITFSFNDRSGRSNIEFSLDGGKTYPLNVKDNTGTATFSTLGIGDYDLLVRWGNNECPVDLGSVTLNEITKAPNESCDDEDDTTENDVIQSDGCTCLGEIIDNSGIVGNGGCDDLLSNPSFENGLTPWQFNSNTRYNRSTKYRADGDYMVWIYKRYSYKDDAIIYQDAVALPGAIYSFNFYAGTHRPSYNHEVAIEFYNQYGAKLKRKAIQIDFDVDNGNILKEYHLSETAPSGTTKIRFSGTADGDYLKLDAICVQVDKSNAQTSGRIGVAEKEEDGLGDTEALYAGSDAVTLGSRIKNEGVQLDWFAKNTTLPSKFIVEKSLDGQNFEQIDEVVVDGLEDLSILDEAPDFGTNYYRVIQQFETGQEIVSNIREEKYMIDPASITIYPNPVSDNLNLRIGHFQSLEGTIRIFSPVGQQVLERKLHKEEKHISIDVSNYKNGMYFLLIEAKNRRPIERQIIVENLE